MCNIYFVEIKNYIDGQLQIFQMNLKSKYRGVQYEFMFRSEYEQAIHLFQVAKLMFNQYEKSLLYRTPQQLENKPNYELFELEKIINQYNDITYLNFKGILVITNVRIIFVGGNIYISVPWITLKKIDKVEKRNKGTFLHIELLECHLN